MTIINHTLGFPRIGLKRELKKSSGKLLGRENFSARIIGNWP
ncbi:hypothetical protein B738_22610 [Photorhabdus temperata subsp. temperata M1021]|nr:hypothetical protein B738_22610 [Photorhabdus temperata subsp. temperata M1021]